MSDFEHIKLTDLTLYDVIDPLVTNEIISQNVVERSFPFSSLGLADRNLHDEHKVITGILDSSLLFQFTMHHNVPLQYWKYKIGCELMFDTELKHINVIRVIENRISIIVNPIHFFNYFLLRKQEPDINIAGYDGSRDDFWKEIKWYPNQVAYAVCACLAPTLNFAYFLYSLQQQQMDGLGVDLLSLRHEDQLTIVNFTNPNRIPSHANKYICS